MVSTAQRFGRARPRRCGSGVEGSDDHPRPNGAARLVAARWHGQALDDGRITRRLDATKAPARRIRGLGYLTQDIAFRTGKPP